MAIDSGGIDRRDFALGCIAVLTAACGRVPAGNAKTRSGLWSQFRERFILPAGRVIDNGNGNISHSESQGYGMLLATFNADRETFDSLARWTAETLLRHDVALHAWKYDPREANPVPDPNNATDGDILIAWALARAASQWNLPDYARRSQEIRKAIRSRLVVNHAGSAVLLPGLEGFAMDGRVIVNPSYYIWSALDAFAALDGQTVWGPVIDDGVKLLTAARFGPLSLPVDWFEIDTAGKIAPARDKPPRFGFDAIRVPLYAAAGRRLSVAQPVVAWWKSLAGSGKPIPAWIDVQTSETAPFALSAGGMAVVGRAMGTAQPDSLSDDYYAAILQLLAHDLR
ncbi:glycosyl hydrolase family 8 [Novosphingobium sp. SL115]|uniref:glycosyl hydrolase family 8 n=1 Tax=Novosphingobium sp. SL115 TaxID=2995150 RepID=UPI0022755C8A|nr:glycosyl hydrolase family 8 [Novosphingobium sp. SL115]MCY1670880.1 glycosyl hydrolase family 8 [Novosphingobium sp. SL115]